MDPRSAPERLRSLPSWLLAQVSLTAAHLVSGRLAPLADHRYHFSMLAALEELGPLSQAELGRRCGLDRSDVAAAVADLEGRRLVDRAPDPADRRRNIVQLTATGRRHLADLDAALGAAQDDLLAPLSPAERRQLTELLSRVAGHHGRPPGD